MRSDTSLQTARLLRDNPSAIHTFDMRDFEWVLREAVEADYHSVRSIRPMQERVLTGAVSSKILAYLALIPPQEDVTREGLRQAALDRMHGDPPYYKRVLDAANATGRNIQGDMFILPGPPIHYLMRFRIEMLEGWRCARSLTEPAINKDAARIRGAEVFFEDYAEGALLTPSYSKEINPPIDPSRKVARLKSFGQAGDFVLQAYQFGLAVKYRGPWRSEGESDFKSRVAISLAGAEEEILFPQGYGPDEARALNNAIERVFAEPAGKDHA